MMKRWDALRIKLMTCLCPPGSGIYTVKSGVGKARLLEKKIYGDLPVEKAWRDSLSNLPTTTFPLLLGICSDTGGSILRGANWGPLLIRDALYQRFLSLPVFELGDVKVIPQLLLDDYINKKTLQSCRKALYQDENKNLPVSPLSIAYGITTDLYRCLGDKKILTLGGDHSIAYPVLKSYLSYLMHKTKQQKKIGVIHFDAHTDIMPHRLGIAVCFGSWVYPLLQSPAFNMQWIQVGIRSSKQVKSYWESHFPVQQFWAKEINTKGIEQVSHAILSSLKAAKIDEIYITFDIDALDMTFASATGTPEPNGLSLEEACYLISALTQAFPLTGADLVEVAPYTNPKYADVNSVEPATTLNSASTIIYYLLQALNVAE